MLFYNYVCRVDLLTILIGIAAGLDPAGDGNLCSLAQVFLSKFCRLTERDARNKIRGLLSVPLVSPIYCQTIPCNGGLVLIL